MIKSDLILTLAQNYMYWTWLDFHFKRYFGVTLQKMNGQNIYALQSTILSYCKFWVHWVIWKLSYSNLCIYIHPVDLKFTIWLLLVRNLNFDRNQWPQPFHCYSKYSNSGQNPRRPDRSREKGFFLGSPDTRELHRTLFSRELYNLLSFISNIQKS